MWTNPVDVIDSDGTDYYFPQYQVNNDTCGASSLTCAIPPSTITDRNGNQIQLQGGGGTYVDSTGRTILNAGLSTAFVGGLNQPYRLNWRNISITGAPAAFVRIPSNVQNASECPSNGIVSPSPNGQQAATLQAVTSIQLPNGQQYTFQYDPAYGFVNKIIYPEGGYVRYVWGNNSLSALAEWLTYTAVPIVNTGNGNLVGSYNQPAGYCVYHYDTPAILHRYVSYDGITEVEEQDFSYTTNWENPVAGEGWSQKTTTVVTHDLVRNTQNQTVYTYGPGFYSTNYGGGSTVSGEFPLENTNQYYDNTPNGSGTVGTLLRTVNKQWSDVDHMTQQQTVDNVTGMVSETDWQFNNNGMLTEKDDYDYGQGTHGGPLRETVYPSYHTFSNPYIVDKPDGVQLLDGGRNVVAGVSYTYDPANANRLSISTWLNASGTSSLTTNLQYDTFGNVIWVKDPQQNYTQYSYSDAFADTCTFTSPSNTYLTQITQMPTNGVLHQENFTYYCASGLLASSMDENTQTTSYYYQDPLNRLTKIIYPTNGNPWGMSTITYNDSANTIETKRLDSNATVWADSITLYDGTHRPISQSTASGETTAAWNRKDTCYDGLGHVFHSTYAYQTSVPAPAGGPFCTAEGDSYTYDALGRGISVTHSDSSSTTTSYLGRAMDVKDEGNGTRQVERITQSDALGRLLYVCEVTGQAQYGVSPTNCGLDYSGTGFLTQYQYTARGDLLNVTQGAETRSFTYDMASRLLTALNPENGLVTYTYDSDGQCTAQTSYLGELISKTDTRGVRTCMQYDALHRVIGKSYVGTAATAPAVSYSYDQTTAFGKSLGFGIGRLTSESTAGPNSTGSIFSYDKMGHIIDNSQCTPQNCGSSMFPVTYSGYNVLGEPGSATDGVGNTYSYAYNSVGRLASLTSSLNDANHPASLLNSIHYNAFGEPVTSTIGTAPLMDLRGYDARGRLGSIWVGNSTSVTKSSATVTIQGTENGRGAPTHSTGSITIGGAENSWQDCDDYGDCEDDYDYGVVYIDVGPYSYNINYGQGDTGTTLAAQLAAQMQGTFSNVSYVTNSQYTATVSFTSVATGIAANYPLSTSTYSYAFNSFYGSFNAGFSNGTSNGSSATGTMTGGTGVSAPWDTGTVSVALGGTTSTVTYGGTDTNSSVAASLAAQINADSSTVTAAASGSVVTITSNTPGAVSDYTFTATSASTAGFGSASFTPSPASGALTGGLGAAVYSVGVSYLPDGNIESSNDSVNGYWLYQYDDFNRLSTAVSSTNLGCAYTYDQYGNQWAHSGYNGGSCGSDPTYAPNTTNNNQIAQLAPYYDPAGNLTFDGFTSYNYDAESRIASVGPGNTASYVYDAEGRRVRKITGAGAVDYLYDLSGHVISEVSASGGWNRGEVYAGGQHVATYDNGTTYFTHADWLGTERLRSNVAGAAVSGSNWTSYPFGEGSATPNPGPTHFTGKERDAESGLDYFGARYFASSMGRWMSPDWAAKAQPVPYAKLDNPQTLNLYQYMRNNPLSGADPDGHCDWCQKLWNGVTGNGFQTNAQIAQTAALNAPTTITETQVDKLPTNPQPTSEAEPKEPNGQVDLAASAAGVLSAAPGVVPGAPGLLLGLGAAGVSSVNDPSGLNLTINAAGGTLGVVSYAAEGTAVGTGAAVGGFGVAVGAMAWSASNWISTNVITPVFTPDANQSNTINANGVTIQAPDAYDWHQP